MSNIAIRRIAQHCKIKPLSFTRSISSSTSDAVSDILHSTTPNQALRIFNSAISTLKYKKIYKPYAAIIHVVTNAKWMKLARCLIKDLIQNIQRNQKSVKACSVAFDVLDSLESTKFTNDVFGGLILAFCEMGLIDQALWVYYKVECLPAMQVCNGFLHGLDKAGKFDLMIQVYNHMLSKGAASNVVTYGILINACFKHCHPKMGLAFFDQMEANEIKPTSVIFTTLITWFCHENKIFEAEQMFRAMQAAGVVPDLFSYTSLIDGYCKVAEIGKALNLYNEMLLAGVSPNVVTFGVLVDALSKLGDMKAARSCFGSMAKFGVSPNLIVYNSLMNGYCKTGDLPEAMEVWSEMERFKVSPDVYSYSILIHGLCGTGRIQEGHILFEEMQMSGIMPNSVTFNTMIDAYSKQGLMEKALALSSEMTEKGIKPNAVTFSALIDGYCKVGNMEAANGLFSEMIIKEITPDVVTYSAMIDGHFKKGNQEAALRLHKEMLETDINQNVFALCSLIDGLCKDEKMDEAVKLFLETVGDANGVVDSPLRPNHVLYAVMIQGLCYGGRINIATKFFSDMRRRELRPDAIAYRILVTGHFNAKQYYSVAMLHADIIKYGCTLYDVTNGLLVSCYQKLGTSQVS